MPNLLTNTTELILPVAITDAILTATDVPENDFPEWNVATPYSIDDQVIVTSVGVHNVYKATSAHTGTDPVVDVDPDTGIGTDWLLISKTNRWAMFSDQITDQTEQADSINVTLTPGEVANGIAIYGLDAVSVTIVVDDPIDGIVYNETILLQDNALVDNFYNYCFMPIERAQDVVFNDLPAYGTADINITIDNTGGIAKCGLVSVGFRWGIGSAANGASTGIIDYSTKERDTFGAPIIVERNFSKRVTLDVLVPTARTASISRKLSALRATPCSWIGSPVLEATIVYGFYRDFDIVYTDGLNSMLSIEIEGLT